MSKNFEYDNFNPYIFEAIPENARVLDVGCATGLLGKKLRRKKAPRIMAGIEIDAAMAKEAREIYDQVVLADLEDFQGLPFKQNYFDVIVCADVLEHLRDPRQVLKNLAPYLSRRGFFLISVPNIAFASVRLALLCGRFNYNPRGGILDETHLRFFTRRSLISLLKGAGLRPISVQGYNLVSSKFFFLKYLGVLFPTLFSIQFLAKAKKNG